MTREEDLDFREFQGSGDPAALARVYDAVAPELFRVALHLTGHPADAEDLLQATCLAAIERRAAWDPARRVRPWLLGILTNQARGSRRRALRPAEAGTHLAADRPGEMLDGPECLAERGELLDQLDAALLKLPESSRSVLLLRLKHGLTVAAIAESLMRPPGTVRSQLARGMEALRRFLPASLAGSLVAALSPPARGLELVRARVIEHATLSKASFLLPKLVGVLIMNKLVVGLAGLFLVLVGWSLFEGVRVTSVSPSAPESVEPGIDARMGASVLPPRAVVKAAEPARPTGTRSLSAPAHEADPGLATLRDTGGVRVHVRFEEDGSSAPGAVVVVRSLVDGHAYPEERHARTASDGTVTIEGLVPGSTSVGILRGLARDVSVRAGELVRLELLIRPGLEVDGEVVDAHGVPLGYAEIWLSELHSWASGHTVARTDAAGRFRLRGVRQDHYLGARHPDFAPSDLGRVRGALGDRVSLRLILAQPGARLTGRVVGADGEALATAEVSVGSETYRVEPGPDGGHLVAAPPLRARVNERGEFVLTGVPHGSCSVKARAPGHGPARTTVFVAPGPNAALELELCGQAELVGRVRDAAGEPLAGVTLETSEPSGFAGTGVVSDLEGRYRLRGLPAGEVELLAAHPDHGRVSARLELAAGEVARWDPSLWQETRIFGRIVDASGAALAHWAVVIQRSGEHVTRVEADADGHFSVLGLPDAAYMLRVKQPGEWRRLPRLVVHDVRPSLEPLLLRVERTEEDDALLAGVLLGPGRTPLEGGEVTLWHAEEKLWLEESADPVTGEFALRGVPPGTCWVTGECVGYPRKALEAFTVTEGERVELGTLVLEEPARVAGTLAGGEEEWLAGVSFQILREGELLEEASVLCDGRRFRSTPLGAGTYVLWIGGDRLRSRRVPFTLEAGQEYSVAHVLEPAGLRRVVLRRPPAARAPRSVHCSLLDPLGEQVWMRELLPQGETLEVAVSAPAGWYTFRAVTNNGLAIEASLEVRTDDSAQVRSLALVRAPD